ncbi:K(+)-transporting ATPase subunit C [Acetobacterium sp.]|uniref:K(+)-transporting ATPase subunit C n=1 Tax=Acetobacterium sp. TaxID=1872094 RepID=UPI002F405786
MKQEKINQMIRPAIVSFLIFTVICGVLYTALMTGIAQAIFPYGANGSIIEIEQNGKTQIYGSEYLGQVFTEPQYLIGRPTTESGGPTNLSALSSEQKALVEQRISDWHALDPGNARSIPMDLVTVSGSGVDPDISVAGAQYQIERIARERNRSVVDIQKIIDENTTLPVLGFLGQPVVNVLKVNISLDALN